MATRNEQPNEANKESFLGVSFFKIADNERDLWPLVILHYYTLEDDLFSFKEDPIKNINSMKYPGDTGFDALTSSQKISQICKMKIFHRVLKFNSEHPYNDTDPNNNEDFQVLPNSLPFELDGIPNISQLNDYSLQMKKSFKESFCNKKLRKQNAKNFNMAYQRILERFKKETITTKEASILCLCLLYCQQRGLTRRYIGGSKVRSFLGMLQELLQGNEITPTDLYCSVENVVIIRRLEGILKSDVINGLNEILFNKANVFRLNVAILTIQVLQIFVLKSGLFVAAIWLMNFVNIVVGLRNWDQTERSISWWRILLEVIFQLIFLGGVSLFFIHSVEILKNFDWFWKIPLPEKCSWWCKIEARGICWAGIAIDLTLTIWLLFFKGRLTDSAFHPFIDLENYF